MYDTLRDTIERDGPEPAQQRSGLRGHPAAGVGGGAGGVRVVADVGVLRATAPALERGRHRAHHTFETYIAEALALVNLTVADVRIKG